MMVEELLVFLSSQPASQFATHEILDATSRIGYLDGHFVFIPFLILLFC